MRLHFSLSEAQVEGGSSVGVTLATNLKLSCSHEGLHCVGIFIQDLVDLPDVSRGEGVRYHVKDEDAGGEEDHLEMGRGRKLTIN